MIPVNPFQLKIFFNSVQSAVLLSDCRIYVVLGISQVKKVDVFQEKKRTNNLCRWCKAPFPQMVMIYLFLDYQI